jgi:hypothetical protein
MPLATITFTAEGWGVFFAFISILVSLYALNKADRSTKATDEITKCIAEKTLNTKFFEEIYFDNIINQLPSALSKIYHDEGKLGSNCDKVKDIIYEMLDRSQFYKYFEDAFYNDIKDSLIKLDELLTNIQDKTTNRVVFEEYKTQIISCTNIFYSNLKQYYSGIK